MTLHRGPLFPTDADLCSTKPRKSPKPIKRFGPYKDVKDLLEVHIDLVSEAFIRSVREQLDKFRADAAFWESATCYSVEVKELNGADVEVHFDASKYVWDEERRFLFHNLVFLTQNHMQVSSLWQFACSIFQCTTHQLQVQLRTGVCQGLTTPFIFSALCPQSRS